MNSHILTCIDTNRFDEAERLCNLMIAGDPKGKLYYEQAFVWGNLRKLIVYFSSAQFKKGLEELLKVEKEMLLLLKQESDAVGLRALRAYYKLKIGLLFANGLYRECWSCVQESYSVLKQLESSVPGILMLQMMIQFEFGNFGLLQGMAMKAKEELKKMKVKKVTCDILILFFKNVSSRDVSQHALIAWQAITKHEKETNASPYFALEILRYDHWLKTKFSNKSLEELVREKL